MVVLLLLLLVMPKFSRENTLEILLAGTGEGLTPEKASQSKLEASMVVEEE